MIKPDRDTIQTVNKLDRTYNNDEDSVIFEKILKQLLG